MLKSACKHFQHFHGSAETGILPSDHCLKFMEVPKTWCRNENIRMFVQICSNHADHWKETLKCSISSWSSIIFFSFHLWNFSSVNILTVTSEYSRWTSVTHSSFMNVMNWWIDPGKEDKALFTYWNNSSLTFLTVPRPQQLFDLSLSYILWNANMQSSLIGLFHNSCKYWIKHRQVAVLHCTKNSSFGKQTSHV